MEALNSFAPNVASLTELEVKAIVESLALWALFIAVHSGLASLHVKSFVERHLPFLAPTYRLLYLTISIAVLYRMGVVTAQSNSDWLFKQAPDWFFWTRASFALLMLGAFHWIVFFVYNPGEFFGITPAKNHSKIIQEKGRMTIHTIHRLVRHPMYVVCILCVLSAARTRIELLHAVLATLYWIFGSVNEEAKLAIVYGPAFKDYKNRVPAFVPVRGFALTKDDAKSLSDTMNDYKYKNREQKEQ